MKSKTWAWWCLVGLRTARMVARKGAGTILVVVVVSTSFEDQAKEKRTGRCKLHEQEWPKWYEV